MPSSDEIEKLVDLVARSRIHELTARVGDRRITITGGTLLPKTTRTIATSPPVGAREPVAAPTPPARTSYRITAPMVGVFHHAEPPVTAGMTVRSGQVIALIESMKLMNDIRSEMNGIVTAMYVDDGLAVEYGQPLFDIEPEVESEEADEQENDE